MSEGSRRRRTVFIAATLGMWLFGTMAADRVLARAAGAPAVTEGLLFEPHSRVVYEASEFTCLISINALGFRGGDFTVARAPDRRRILAIGDSFTYGWGVAGEEAWPAVLERLLGDTGLPAEVANLGKPGGWPRSYADLAERVVPLLQPDLIIVALLQGDDLLALRDKTHARTLSRPRQRIAQAAVADSVAAVLRAAFSRCYPNLTRYLLVRRLHRAADRWVVMAAAVHLGFNDVQRRRFSRLDPEVRGLFFAGRLNPAALLGAMSDPLTYLRDLDLNAAQTQASIARLAHELTRIKAVADMHGARVVVAAVPSGPFVNQAAYAGQARVGFILRPSLLQTDAMDHAIRDAAAASGLPVFTPTEQFRARADEELYFELDGHFSAAGHALFAAGLAPVVQTTLSLTPQTAP